MATYYIDFENGREENDGLPPLTPKGDYRTIDVQGGDRILFKRGSFVRDHLHAKRHVTYGSYGEGTLPTFCGSCDVSAKQDWEPTETEYVWKCRKAMDGDVGNLIFHENDCTAALKWDFEALAQQGDFFSRQSPSSEGWTGKNHKSELYLYSVGHPTLVYSHIEAAAYGVRQLVNLDKGMTFEDLRSSTAGFTVWPVTAIT